MAFPIDTGGAGGVMAGYEVLARIIAERKKDELIRQKEIEDARQFDLQQRQLEEQTLYRQQQQEETKLYHRSLLEQRVAEAKALNENRALQEEDRQRSDLQRQYQETPATQVTADEYARAIATGGVSRGLFTPDPIVEGAPQTFQYKGGADWQQREDAAKAKVEAREDTQAAALERGMTMAGITAALRAGQGLNQNQLFGATERLAGDWTRATAKVKDTQRQMAVVDAGINALDRGDRNAASQTLVVTFNKLLDDISVVREGEFLRTVQGQALHSRVAGTIQALTEGGVRMSDEDLRTLARQAKEIGAEVIKASDLPAVRQRITGRATRFGIHPEDVFGEDTLGTEAPVPPPGAASAPAGTPAPSGKFKIERVVQ